MKIVFKNLEPTNLARDIVKERFDSVMEKFPSLYDHKITITLEMENSPHQAGQDLFTVSSRITGYRFKNLKLRKSSDNFYIAISNLADGLNDLISEESVKWIEKGQKVKQINPGELYE